MKQSEDLLRREGFTVHHRHPPHVLKGIYNRSTLKDLSAPNILLLTDKPVPEAYISLLPEECMPLINAWNFSFLNASGVTTTAQPHLPPILNDCRIPAALQQQSQMLPLIQKTPSGAGNNDTSEYLIGKVLLNIILPESTGTGTENWTADQETLIQQEIEAGCQFWINLDSRAHLSFTYHYLYGRVDAGAQVSVEPISLIGGSMNEGVWINEIMDNAGYTSYSANDYLEQVRHFDRDTRDAYTADWAVTVFVVNSFLDVDGSFTDGACAYSYLGGPFLVMTYDNATYGINNMDYVFSHECAHSFWALDEYFESYSYYNNENTRCGYLDIVNGNFEITGISDVSCIMRDISAYTAASPVCTYTLQQVGWRDTDGDNIFDITDTLSLAADDSMTFSDRTLQITGTATVLPAYENQNSFKNLLFNFPLNDISILTIPTIEYRLNNSSWTATDPGDGAFGGQTETFLAQINIPASGFSLVSIRAVDSLGEGLLSPIEMLLLEIDNSRDFFYSGTFSETLFYLTIAQQTFSDNVAIIINTTDDLPPPYSNAGQLRATGIGINMSISTSELPRHPITLTIGYDDASISGMNESNLCIAYYDETWDSWVPLTGTIDHIANTVTVHPTHCSYFQIMELIALTTVNRVKAYPNPFNPKKGHTQIVFSNLSAQATITIYTLLGELVTTIQEDDSDGMAVWDTTNTGGRKVATGTYIYRIHSNQYGNKQGRVVILR